jgi:hypothetical protein
MTDPACTLSSITWPMAAVCPACGHAGALHPGASDNDHCIHCDLENHLAVLAQVINEGAEGVRQIGRALKGEQP